MAVGEKRTVRLFSTVTHGEGGRLLSHGLRERNGGVNVRKERAGMAGGKRTVRVNPAESLTRPGPKPHGPFYFKDTKEGDEHKTEEEEELGDDCDVRTRLFAITHFFRCNQSCEFWGSLGSSVFRVANQQV